MATYRRRRTEGAADTKRDLADRGRKEKFRDEVRARIADGAARLVSDGMTDYHTAKLKAAHLLGVGDSKSLPDNCEIEAALRERLALFQADSQPAAIERMRKAALEAMRWLDRFSPWIAGAVLNGTANDASAIELELIEIEPKAFELFLLNEGVDLDMRPPGKRERPSFAMQYELERDDVPVLVALFDNHAQRQAAYPRDSIRHERAQLADAEKRFLRAAKR